MTPSVMWLNGVMSNRRVIWSVTPDQTKSPYIRDVAKAIEAEGWTVETLSVRQLIATTKQVVHVQWPEHVSRGASPAATAAKHARAIALLAALRLRKHSVVLTAHNRAPHGKSDRFDAWFRRALQRTNAATILLVPGHEAELRSNDAINPNAILVTIPHPTHPPVAPLELAPAADRHLLVVLGQIHPYHRIEEFLDALGNHGSTRPVLIAGGVGDEALAARLEARAQRSPWLTVRRGFADDESLGPDLQRAAALVSLQRNTFNSGGPFYALPRGLPIIISAGAQADDLRQHAGDEWVFAAPDDVRSLDVDELNRWIRQDRCELNLEYFALDTIAASHIELYELLRS